MVRFYIPQKLQGYLLCHYYYDDDYDDDHDDDYYYRYPLKDKRWGFRQVELASRSSGAEGELYVATARLPQHLVSV